MKSAFEIGAFLLIVVLSVVNADSGYYLNANQVIIFFNSTYSIIQIVKQFSPSRQLNDNIKGLFTIAVHYKTNSVEFILIYVNSFP